MAILFFYIDEKKGDKISVKLDKHEGEKETDLSYKWGQYALGKAIELNFEKLHLNPYVVDQGARIHILSGQIMRDNPIDSYGIPLTLSNSCFSEDFEDGVYEYRTTFEPSTVEDGANLILEDNKYVHIVLDMHDASKYIGGFNTPTAISAGLVYHTTKEHAEKLATNEDISY